MLDEQRQVRQSVVDVSVSVRSNFLLFLLCLLCDGKHRSPAGAPSQTRKHVATHASRHASKQLNIHSSSDWVHLQASNKTSLGSSQNRFSFRNGSIGNFFFAGARVFFGSLDAAIFLFSRVARISEGSEVLPAILTDNVITLGAECSDGSLIRGQNNISHPPTAGNVGTQDVHVKHFAKHPPSLHSAPSQLHHMHRFMPVSSELSRLFKRKPGMKEYRLA